MVSHWDFLIFCQSRNLAMADRELWFGPWEALLELIRVTGDNVPVNLSRIVQITDTSEDQAKDLIKLLLLQNPLLGKYDETTKIYSKGIEVDDYIDFVLKRSDTKD